MPRKKTEAAPFYDPATGQPAKIEAAKPVRNVARGVETAGKAPATPSQLPRMANAVHVDLDNQPDLTADADLQAKTGDEREHLKSDIARIRGIRKPFGAFTQKLAIPQRPGYRRHWFSDEPGRVDEAASNGWAHVKDKDGKPVKRVVGRGRDGGPMYGFAMELPKIFWDEDMAAKHRVAQDRIDEIKKNPIRAKTGQSDRSDEGKFYSPKDEVLSIQSGR